jgi:hypothetical protein
MRILLTYSVVGCCYGRTDNSFYIRDCRCHSGKGVLVNISGKGRCWDLQAATHIRLLCIIESVELCWLAFVDGNA